MLPLPLQASIIVVVLEDEEYREPRAEMNQEHIWGSTIGTYHKRDLDEGLG